MSLGLEPEVPGTGPVDIPGLLILTLVRDPPKRVPGRQPVADSSQGRRDNDESEDENDLPPPAQGPVPLPGGGDGDPPQDGNDDEDEEDEDDESSDSEMGEAKDEQPEDPDNAGMGKSCKPQTPHGKAMAKMFRCFCDLAM